jgi:hypothetical protein
MKDMVFYGEGCTNIHILTGPDTCGLVFTRKMYKLQCGLVARETRLGWLIMGRVPCEKNQGVSTLAVTSLLTHNAAVAEVWS